VTELLIKEKANQKNGIRYKLIIIESLIFALPFLIVTLVLYQGDYSLNLSHIILLAIVIILILVGMLIVRQIFEKISTVACIMKKVESGTLTQVEIKKDIAELHDISISFNQLVLKLEQTTAELNCRSLELLTIKELSEMAKKSLKIEDLMELLLNQAMTLTGAKVGSVFVIDEESRRFQIIASKDSDNELIKGSYINIDDSIVKWVIVEQKTLLVEDIERDPRTLKPNDSRYGSPSFLSMPIIVGNKVISVLNLANKQTGRIFTVNDDHALSIMLSEISFALENAMLHLEAAERLRQIEKHNADLKNEIKYRLEAEEKQAVLNDKLEEANRQLSHAYAKMKESRDKLRGSLFNEEIGFILDADGIIEGVTEKAIECTLQSRNKLIGSLMIDLLSESCRGTFMLELKQAWKGIGRSMPVELSSEINGNTSYEIKLTRLSLYDKRILLAILN
jgi:two-component system, cell cycle sensor histidine kinase and response regulator CckA